MELPRRDFYTSPFADRPSRLSDALKARAEATALARLIALKETQAPLAIGIFGDWGAGKSSFMETIEDIVGTQLQGRQNYCEKIVQIRFNAWHYIETNLWASLVSHIFTELDRALRKEIGEPIDALYGGLATARRQELEAARQLIAAKEALDKTRADAQQTLAGPVDGAALGVASLARETFRTFYQQLDTADQARIDDAVKDLGIAEGKEAWEKAEIALFEAQSLAGRARLVYGEFRRSWRSGDAAPLIWACTLGLVALTAIFFGSAIAGWLGLGLGMVGGIGTATIGFVTALSRLPQLAGGVLALFERAYRSRDEARRVAIAAAEKEIADRQAQLTAAVAEFGDVTPFARITRFIRGKAADETYAKHLGLVATIRRDFEVLTQYIVKEVPIAVAPPDLQSAEVKTPSATDPPDLQSDEANVIARARQILADIGQAATAPSKEQAKTVEKGLKPFGRIILYIDDLDRCTSDKVVEVLQAVHLLLAFELFVVVLAVDYRWIGAALARAYRGQLKRPGDRDVGATPADYLEKIFQIPYWVRRLDDISSQKFLSDLIAEAHKSAQTAVPPLVRRVPPDAPEATTTIEQTPALVLSRIEILEAEESLLLALAPYAGNTPRQLKRFLNLYRVIKASADGRETSADGREMPWQATMFLLAIATAARTGLLVFCGC
jgi:hypothetical protein